MGAGTRPSLYSIPWIPPCSLWSTSTTSQKQTLCHITTWRSVRFAFFEGRSVGILSTKGWKTSPCKSPSCRHGDQKGHVIVAKHCPCEEKLTAFPPAQNRHCFTTKLLVDCKQKKKEEAKRAGRRGFRSRGVLALLASQTSKCFLKLLQEDLHVKG